MALYVAVDLLEALSMLTSMTPRATRVTKLLPLTTTVMIMMIHRLRCVIRDDAALIDGMRQLR